MTTMISELYEALIDAGASEEKAREAAKATAEYEDRFSRIDSDLRILKWMVGAILAGGVISLIIRNFFPVYPTVAKTSRFAAHCGNESRLTERALRAVTAAVSAIIRSHQRCDRETLRKTHFEPAMPARNALSSNFLCNTGVDVCESLFLSDIAAIVHSDQTHGQGIKALARNVKGQYVFAGIK